MQAIRDLWALNTVSTDEFACTLSQYQILTWRSRLWNSEMDVRRRWLCAPVTSRSDVRHYVDFRFSQWLLLIVVQYQWQFAFIEVTWQLASKHINKWIMCETVSMYRSQCVAVSGVKGSGSEILKLFEICHCFNW